MSDKKPEAAKAEGAPATEEARGGGGFQAWLPLILSLVLMPVLAFATTKFLIIPKVVQARGAGHDAEEGHDEAGHGATKNDDDHGAKGGSDGKESGRGQGASKKQTVPISKVIVNVAGSMGSRYLMTSFTLSGTHKEFKTVIEENKDQLLDLANTAMASKTISDLEKPGARNQLRAELISIFNNALGGTLVQEIYFTEFAVQ